MANVEITENTLNNVEEENVEEVNESVEIDDLFNNNGVTIIDIPEKDERKPSTGTLTALILLGCATVGGAVAFIGKKIIPKIVEKNDERQVKNLRKKGYVVYREDDIDDVIDVVREENYEVED